MKTKVCSKCQSEKSVTEFTKNSGTKDDLRSWCKGCCAIKRKEYYHDNKEKELTLSKAYAKTDHGKEVLKISQNKYKKTLSGKDVQSRGNKKYRATENGKEVTKVCASVQRQRYPEKVRARREVRDKLKTGELIKQPCLVCGKRPTEFRIEAHHYLGYEEEHWLDVEWYCPKHHREADEKLKEI